MAKVAMNSSFLPPPCEGIDISIVLFGAFAAITLGKDLTVAEQDLLGNFFQVIGQNLTSMASAKSDCKSIVKNHCPCYQANEPDDTLVNKNMYR